MTRTALFLPFALMLSMVAACGEGENPASTRDRSDAGATSGLSAAYASTCARCHGDLALGTINYPKLPGVNSNSEETFITFVRTGKGEMEPAAASKISDADLKADFAWMTTKR